MDSEHDRFPLALRPKPHVTHSPSLERSRKRHESRRRRSPKEQHRRPQGSSLRSDFPSPEDPQLRSKPGYAEQSSLESSMPSSPYMLTNYNHNLEDNPWRWPDAEELKREADFDTSSDSEIEAELQSQEEIFQPPTNRTQSLSGDRIHYTISRTDDWLSLACSLNNLHTKSPETDSDLLEDVSLSQEQDSASLRSMSEWVDTIRKEQIGVVYQRTDYQDRLSWTQRQAPTDMSAQDITDLADGEDPMVRTREYESKSRTGSKAPHSSSFPPQLDDYESSVGFLNKRTRSGCQTCRKRKKLCDGRKPECEW